MNCTYLYKTSDHLSPAERSQFLDLFSTVFPKTLTFEDFENKYLKNPLGYAFHGLMVSDRKIVGAYNVIPYGYRYFGRQTLFGLSVDTMIHPDFRSGPFGLHQMAHQVLSRIQQEGVSFVFGFPNEQAISYTQKVLKWNTVGELDFYALPRHVGKVVPSLKWLNPVSRACSDTLVRQPFARRRHTATYAVEKIRDNGFMEHRYHTGYNRIVSDHHEECVYRMHREPGDVNTLYVIDVWPLTPAAFDRSIRQIYEVSGRSADLILYVGKLPFQPIRMVKLPRTRQPRRLYMCGRVLDPGRVDDRIFHIQNWNINISNFDVR